MYYFTLYLTDRAEEGRRTAHILLNAWPLSCTVETMCFSRAEVAGKTVPADL